MYYVDMNKQIIIASEWEHSFLNFFIFCFYCTNKKCTMLMVFNSIHFCRIVVLQSKNKCFVLWLAMVFLMFVKCEMICLQSEMWKESLPYTQNVILKIAISMMFFTACLNQTWFYIPCNNELVLALWAFLFILPSVREKLQIKIYPLLIYLRTSERCHMGL